MGLDMNFYTGKILTTDDIIYHRHYLDEVDKLFGKLIQEKKGPYNLDEIQEKAKQLTIGRLLGENPNLPYIVKTIDDLAPLSYFRKHSDLHGYIGEHYLHPIHNDDNTIYAIIDQKGVKNILDIAKRELIDESDLHYQGFFWGKSTKEDWERTIQMLENLRLEDDECVYYYAWY